MELAELVLALLLAYDCSGAGNHNPLWLTNGAEQKFLTLTLTKINEALFLQKYMYKKKQHLYLDYNTTQGIPCIIFN